MKKDERLPWPCRNRRISERSADRRTVGAEELALGLLGTASQQTWKCMSSFCFLLSFFILFFILFFSPNCFADYSSILTFVFPANVPIRISLSIII